MSYIITYLGSALVFFSIDMIWLGFVAKNMYRTQLGHLLSDQVNWISAIIFYLIFILGIFIFCVYPAVEQGSFVKALLLGAIFGAITYATYDLTNLATLKNWPLSITLIDITWGSVLSLTTSATGYLILSHLNK